MATYTPQQAADIKAFVDANLANPKAIADAAKQYGVTAEDLQQTTGYTMAQIGQYFSDAGINPTTWDPVVKAPTKVTGGSVTINPNDYVKKPGGPAPNLNQTVGQQVYSPEEQAARNAILNQAGTLFNQGQTLQPFPGAAPAPFSADTTAAQNTMRSFAVGPGSTVAGQTANALKFGLGDVLYPSSNPALQQTLDTATRKVGEAYTDPGGVLSGIRGHFTAGNSGGSGTREGIAGGLAARSYLNTIGDVTGKITSDAYNQGLQTFSNTLNTVPSALNSMMTPALAQGAVGTQLDTRAQAELDYAANKNLWGMNAPWTNLQNYANVVYGASNPTTVTTGAASVGAPNPLAPVGTALSGASIAAALGIDPMIGGAAGLLLSLFDR